MLTPKDASDLVELEKEAEERFSEAGPETMVIFRMLEEPIVSPEVWEEFKRRQQLKGRKVSEGSMEITVTRGAT